MWTKNKSKEEKESRKPDRMKSKDTGTRTMLLAALRIVVVAMYWLVLKLVVVPVEGLLHMNGWQAELRLTAGLTFATIKCSEVFDCAIPMRIWFPQELRAHAVVVQIVEMDVSDHV
ncbi:hypothetical protein EI94DRAFT_1700552 [Lactarius quietus]|nr:hypothetical protein EI94DRAFT_1700552 [Lactarius quietus]